MLRIYRFVIRDEEEKSRILIWLFKPRIHLAYTTPRSHAIPKSANILAAKVLYKLIKPSESDSVCDLRDRHERRYKDESGKEAKQHLHRRGKKPRAAWPPNQQVNN
ncbi:hypothetical protein BDZ97DRAFT_1880738 [Flammula alnicola]|nr:hypothetical protein BDZ97DRAFT_1880738 [Flammula alnicola]